MRRTATNNADSRSEDARIASADEFIIAIHPFPAVIRRLWNRRSKYTINADLALGPASGPGRTTVEDAMNSRERVRAALRRQPTDRVPIYMWFHPDTARRLGELLEIPARDVGYVTISG